MKNSHAKEQELEIMTAAEVEQVSGGTIYGTVGVSEDGRYEIVSTTGKSPLYVRFGGKWVPIGTEPFIGPPASELGI